MAPARERPFPPPAGKVGPQEDHTQGRAAAGRAREGGARGREDEGETGSPGEERRAGTRLAEVGLEGNAGRTRRRQGEGRGAGEQASKQRRHGWSHLFI